MDSAQPKADAEGEIAFLLHKIEAENQKQKSIEKQMEPIEEQLHPFQKQIQNSREQQIELKKQIAIIRLKYYQQVKGGTPLDLKNVKLADLEALSAEVLEQLFIIRFGYKFELSEMDEQCIWVESSGNKEYMVYEYKSRIISQLRSYMCYDCNLVICVCHHD